MLFASSADRLRDRVREWWRHSVFNRIDLIIFGFAITGFILRWFPSHFVPAKTIYCVNCVCLYVRFLRDYSASSSLGPKLVMILRMVSFFSSIFLCVSYAVANSTFSHFLYDTSSFDFDLIIQCFQSHILQARSGFPKVF